MWAALRFAVTIAVSEAALGVGFQLLAKFEQTLNSPDEILREMEVWVKEYAVDLVPSTRIGFSDTSPTLFCQLHPAAEDLELSILDLDHFVACAKTSTVGPGFHIFVCDMLHKLGTRFNLTWITDNEDYFDEADYFFSGNQERVLEEMANWLGGLCRLFFDGTFKDEPGNMPTALCLRMFVAFEADARAVTPLGPRNLPWLKKVSENGRVGSDFFAWWKPGLNAEYFLGRALSRMWTDIRWRKPINDSERDVLEYVVNSLDIAFKLDGNLSYPWPEWAEILDFLERDDSEPDLARSRANGIPTIGYRRRNVRVTLPGHWILNVPGSLSEFDADENGDFSAQDPPKTIWFSSWTFVDSPDQRLADARGAILDKSPGLLEEREGYIGWAEIEEKREDDEKYFVLTSSNVCRKGKAVVSVVFTDPEDRAWAEGVWRSLQPPKGKSSDE
ncbi:MAG TPA: hypothetical protein VF532_18485 [Candidatus Angelobacter sp.]